MPAVIQVLLTDFPNPTPSYFSFQFSNIPSSQFDMWSSLLGPTHSFRYYGLGVELLQYGKWKRWRKAFASLLTFPSMRRSAVSLTLAALSLISSCRTVWTELTRQFGSWDWTCIAQWQTLSLWHQWGSGVEWGAEGLAYAAQPVTSG